MTNDVPSPATRAEKIAAIRAVCIEANPAIVELTFGCRLRRRDGGVYYCLQSPVVPDGRIWVTSMPFGSMPLELEKDLIHNGGEFEVLGRTVRLADMMLALHKHAICVYATGYFRFEDQILDACWKLEHDDLNDQDDPTIDCLYSFLA